MSSRRGSVVLIVASLASGSIDTKPFIPSLNNYQQGQDDSQRQTTKIIIIAPFLSYVTSRPEGAATSSPGERKSESTEDPDRVNEDLGLDQMGQSGGTPEAIDSDMEKIGPLKKRYMSLNVDTETGVLEEVVVELDEDEADGAEDFRNIRKDQWMRKMYKRMG